MRRYHPDRHSADSDKSEIANEPSLCVSDRATNASTPTSKPRPVDRPSVGR